MRDNVDVQRRAVIRTIAMTVPAAGLARIASATVPSEAASGDTAASSANTGEPGKTWDRFESPDAAGFKASALEAMEQILYAKPTSSLMIVKGGKIAYSYGDTAEISYLASARKSVLSMLYGKYVENGKIDINRTIGDIGINEGGEGLMPIEKSATVRDLLMSSSGVYWPAGSPGGAGNTPPRGSKKPGSYFLYNNWDFNVAGAVFEQLTGKTVFQALKEDLAIPLQFQDFDIARQRMLGYASNPSRYKAYHLFLSGRDMARLGVVMVNGGTWKGKQIVPAAWIKESTALHVNAADMAGRQNGGVGYAYLWWKPTESRKSPEWADSFLANGNFGQYLLVLPAIDTVIVHRRVVTDEFAIARNVGKTAASPAGGETDFLAIADMIVAARTSGAA